ncbi:ImmA/IrrE family metallo-endopeptidase [Candidatus Bipolaricaulota bacterium]|nr:ImmA/IrrE family metallo-endopeptidase [Candidatus Bipolaricaulota bacterium]
MATSVSVKPSLLKWARERALMTPQDLADLMKVSKGAVLEWEATGSLSLSRLEKWAKRTRTPVGYLFLREPPDNSLPIADFRTHSGSADLHPSPDLLEVVHICQRRQAWYREFALYEGSELLPFVGSVGINWSHTEIAAKIRASLTWDNEARAGLASWEDALRELTERVETLGILVMRSGIVGSNTRRTLDVAEFRGFALADDFSPLIFVNSVDARTAQMFTLMHELVHIWLGESGISDISMWSDNQSERLCNRVAAEVLVPIADFMAAWQQSDDVFNEARRLARLFKVSTYVVLIRALDSGTITPEEFYELYNHAQSQIRVTKSSGGDFYRTQGVRLGKRFTSAVILSALEGRTAYVEAFRLLGVKSEKTFDRIARNLGVTD